MSETETKQSRSGPLVRVLKELIGTRSIRRAAEDSGVTAAYISQILNGKRFPSADVLRQLAAESAKPQNGVTLEKLLIAAGYLDTTTVIDGHFFTSNIPELNVNTPEGRKIAEQMIRSFSESELPKNRLGDRSSITERTNEENIEIMKTAIFSALGEKRIPFMMLEDEDDCDDSPKLCIELYKRPITTWYFDYVAYVAHIKDTISRYLFIEPDDSRKISIVCTDRNCFIVLYDYIGRIAYRGEMSAILVEPESRKVLMEEYLSHYEEGDDTKEIRLV